MTINHNLPSFLIVLDQMRAIALEGLKYAKDPYDIDRYNKLIAITAKSYSEVLQVDQAFLVKKILLEIGIVTPKLGAEAAVLNQQEQLLILKRSDDSLWCLPCGWVDVAESPAEASAREVREETGLTVFPDSYIAISCKGPSLCAHLYHQVNTITLMKPVPPKSKITLSHEHTDYKWIDVIDKTIEWHPGHKENVQRIFGFLNSDRLTKLPI